MKYLTKSMYERILMHALQSEGLPPIVAERLISARWPMTLSGLIAEFDGRGAIVSREDLIECLADLLPNAAFDFEAVLYADDMADVALAWLVQNDKARPTPAALLYQTDDSWVKRKFGTEPAAGAANLN